jgi:hypothetical protein
MNKHLNLIFSTSTTVLTGLLLIAGCSSSDGGTPAAQVPANAIIIDDTNAESTVASAINTVSTLQGALPRAETTLIMGLPGALELIKTQIKSLLNTGADPEYVAAITDSGDCFYGGTYSVTFNEGGTYPNYTENGSATFVNCNNDNIYILNGNVSYTDTWNEQTGDYSGTAKGTISIENIYDNTKYSFSGMDYAENGNDLTYGSETYTITKSTYSIDFIIAGTSGGGYLASLLAPVVESSGGYYSCPESGHLLVKGGNNTTAEGIYNGDGTMTIKANGAVVDPSATCYY